MPFAINIIRRLAAAGWDIDVFLWEKPKVDYNEIFPSSVKLRYQVLPKRILLGLRPVRLTASFSTQTSYACAFGLGQIGSYLGAVISFASRCPLVILNDEFPSFWARTLWTRLERWAAQRANVIIVPSADRILHLAQEFDLSDQREKFVVFRNAPMVAHPLERHDWHALLGIPPGRRIFLNAGTLGDWAQVPEILSTTVHWPPDTALLLHSRSAEQSGYREQLSHLDVAGKVFWTSAPLSEKLLNSLVAHCSGSFALYRNIGANILHTGASSGKLMRSVMCGTPVIVNQFDCFSFVSKEGIGLQVGHPSEIPAALYELMQKETEYRKRCLRFAAEEVIREQKDWEMFVAALANKLDVHQVTHN